jgi:hypothetical protein
LKWRADRSPNLGCGGVIVAGDVFPLDDLSRIVREERRKLQK